MEKFSKKTLLNYVNGAGLYGSPAPQSTVKFQFATNLATAATNNTAGALTFAADAAGNAGIWVQGTLVSSAIQKVEAAAADGNKHGGKTVNVTYIVAATGEVTTSKFNVIDEAGLEAYFGSKTIALDASTDKFEVKVKENGGIAIDNDGIYAVLDNIFAVDGKTIDFKSDNKTIETKVKIAYVAANDETGQKAAIQLQDADSTKLSEVTVESLIGSGIVKGTSYDAATNKLTINWVGGATTIITLSDIFDISDWAVKTDSTDYLSLDINEVAGTAEIGVTSKVKTGINLAETALQGLSKVTGAENYVTLTVADGSDPSTKTVSISDAALNTKIVALDAKDSEIESSIGRLNSSVSAIETKIAGMDADLSVNALNGSIGITLSETDGKVTAIDITATEAKTTFTPASDSIQASLESTSGILTGSAIEDIVAYVDAKSSAIDSSLTSNDTPNYVSIHEEQVDGKITVFTVNTSYGNYDKDSQVNGLATTVATKTYIDSEIQSLDLANNVKDASAVDGAGFVKTVISETDGIVKNESVTVTYGDYSTHANGIAKTADTSVFVGEQITAALTWQVLN